MKEGWSPKKEIWNAKHEKKRKAKEASLSSEDEWSKKKIDVKDKKITMIPLPIAPSTQSFWILLEYSLLMTNSRNGDQE